MLYWFAHRHFRGFTQIELSVMVLVIGILAAIAAPNLMGWYRQKQVDAALEQIDMALQEAQNEAVKQHKECFIILSRGENVSLGGNCLLSNRTLTNVKLDHGAFRNPWTITFDMNGENRDPANDPGTLWISSTDGDVREKCLVISTGIGLRRTGDYDGQACITP